MCQTPRRVSLFSFFKCCAAVRGGLPVLFCFVFLFLLQGNKETGLRNAKETFLRVLLFTECDVAPDPMLFLCDCGDSVWELNWHLLLTVQLVCVTQR